MIKLITDNFAVIVTVGGVALTALGGIVVSAINSRSTTVQKFITELRAENTERQLEIDNLKNDRKEDYDELKKENKELNKSVRILMKRLHVTQDHVDVLRQHISDGKGPPIPDRPKGYYGLEDESNT